jgi:hypothetical protein
VLNRVHPEAKSVRVDHRNGEQKDPAHDEKAEDERSHDYLAKRVSIPPLAGVNEVTYKVTTGASIYVSIL